MTDIAIIGAGPGGIACAVQLARYGIIPLLFEKDIPGGLLKNANLVENYLGFPGGIPGISLTDKLAKQLELSGVPLIREKVVHVSYKKGKYKIETNRNKYSCPILVIASGTSPLQLDNRQSTIDNQQSTIDNQQSTIDNRKSTIDNRIFYEVYPLRDLRDAAIAIIGAGDAAFDYALQLSSYNKVSIYNRSDRVKCLPVLFQRAMNHPHISYLENHTLKEIVHDPALNCLKISFLFNEKLAFLMADYIIFAIGRRPELSYADPGLISLFEQLQQESKLYLVGDVKNDMLRQASIAAGDGIRAAMQIYFNESNKKDLR
jgi:thioredoxin reductase (NADPH)